MKMRLFTRTLGISVLSAFLPLFLYAQQPNTTYLENFLGEVQDSFDLLLPIAVGLALLAFLWGLVKFIFNAGNERTQDQGKRIMVWGAIALFVIVSVWGIVFLIGEIFEIGQGGELAVPGTDPGTSESGDFSDRPLFDYIESAKSVLNLLLPIALGVALLFFIWGLARFIFNAGDESALAVGKRQMFWGIISITVIVSLWGIIVLLGEIFGTGLGETCPPPQIGENSVSSCDS